MVTAQDYALLALRVYDRIDTNKGPLPDGWIELSYRVDDPETGFSAGAYQNAAGELVISFTGTNQDKWTDFEYANIPAAAGLPSFQVTQAIEYVSAIRASFSGPLSFTGHSLGGGLASLMAIYFNRPATIFDPAPFRNSAHNDGLLGGVAGSILTRSTVGAYFDEYQAYQTAHGRTIDANFGQYNNSFSSNPLTLGANSEYAARESNVQGFYTTGEILYPLRLTLPTIASQLTPIAPGSNSLGLSTLHSMGLLAALQLSEEFHAALNHSNIVTDALFDEELYAQDEPATAPERDFLTDLVRNHVGVEGETNSSGNNLLDLFAHDVQRVTPEVDFLLPEELQSALVAGVMEYYYEGDFLESSATPDEFTEAVDGGVHLDFDDTAVDDEDLGRHRLIAFAENLLAPTGFAVPEALDSIKNWWVSTQLSGTITASESQDAIIGYGAVTINAGDGDDVVILSNEGHEVQTVMGGAGTDTIFGGIGGEYLEGGIGNDILYGGRGGDTYIFHAGDGVDTITGDDDGGRIVVDGISLSGGTTNYGTISRPLWAQETSEQTFVYRLVGATSITSGERINYRDGTLYIEQFGSTDVIVVENYSTGDLDLDLYSEADDEGNPSDDMDRSNRPVDPMVLDLDGDGVNTIDVGQGIHFDHDGNGFAEQTGWIDADDGILVRDLNGNGLVDNGFELFGDNTLLANGTYAADGFLALADLDGNHDGVMNASDGAFSQLRIWKDLDSDGVTDAGELRTLAN
ncbi:MAG TPA: Mbeg1-like protein, partial [Bryobacteraceae bacterium]|nr:Mbeg1-like protein [Bryobacteraceae bacterium]